MVEDFKKFALRGNVIDLAIAVILGIAFEAVIQSLVDDVLLNLIAGAVGRIDFSMLITTFGDAQIRYGEFLTAVVNFLLIAFALFLVVRSISRATGLWGKGDDPAPMMRDCPYCKTSIPADASKCSACTSQVRAAA